MDTELTSAPAVAAEGRSHDVRARLWWQIGPLALFAATGLMLYSLDIQTVHEPVFLLATLSAAVFIGVSLVSAFLAAIGFVDEGSPTLLFLGAGMLAFGLGNLLGPIVISAMGTNEGVTAHNIAALFAGMFYVTSAGFVWRTRRQVVRRRVIWLSFWFLLSASVTTLLTVLAIEHMLPTFITPAGAATPLRDFVLTVAISLYVLAAVTFWVRARQTGAEFLGWSAAGLALIAVGLTSVAFAVVGSPLSWSGRVAQNVGQVYLLVCLVAALRPLEGGSSAGSAIGNSFRQIEQALQESRLRYDVLLEAANDGVLLYEPATKAEAGRVIEANSAMRQMLGYTREEILAREPRQLVIEGEPRFPHGAPVEAGLHDRTLLVSTHLLAHNGAAIPVEISARRINYEGRPLVLAVARDITARLEAQSAIELEASIARGINRILRAAMTARDEESLGREALEVAESLTGSPSGFILEQTGEDEVTPIVINGPGMEPASVYQPSAETHDRMKGLYAAVLERGQTLVTNRPFEHPRSAGVPDDHPPLTSFLGVPVRTGNKVIGVIGVGSRPGGYGDRECQTLEAIAPAFAETLERFRAEKWLAESAWLSDGLTRIEAQIHGSLDFDDIAASALKTGSEVLGAATAALSMYEPPFFRVAHAFGFAEQIVGTDIPQDDEPHSLQALETMQPVLIEDVEHDERVDAAHLLSYGVHAVLVLPLVVGGRAIGNVYYNFREPHRFSELEMNFGRRLSTSLSLAMENARLFEGTERNARINEALARVDRSLHATLSQEEVLRRAAEESADAIGAESIVLCVRERQGWVVRYAYHMPESVLGRVFTIEEAPHIDYALRAQGPIAIEDALHDPRINRETQGQLGVQAVIVTPVLVGGEAAAVLFFDYHQPRKFSSSDKRYAAQLAASIGLAITNARLYESERRIAETLQETLVVIPSHVPGVLFSRAYETATYQEGRVGGDFVDIFEVHGNWVGVAIGDVSGKGIDAAVTTSLVRNTLRVHAVDGLSPVEVCNKTNAVVRKFTTIDSFVTVFFGLLNTRTGLLRYVCAGHPTGIVYSAPDDIRELLCPDPILGAFDETVFNECHTVLGAGDRLLLYSDGVTEARSPSGEFLGYEGLLRLLRQRGEGSTLDVAGKLMQGVKEFSAGVLRDDAAFLVVEPQRLRETPDPHPQLELD